MQLFLSIVASPETPTVRADFAALGQEHDGDVVTWPHVEKYFSRALGAGIGCWQPYRKHPLHSHPLPYHDLGMKVLSERASTCTLKPVSLACREDAAENEKAEPMLSSFINAAICSQRSLPSAVAFTLAHRLADVNEEDELTTMFCMFTDALAGVRNSTLADLLAVKTRASFQCRPNAAQLAPCLRIHKPPCISGDSWTRLEACRTAFLSQSIAELLARSTMWGCKTLLGLGWGMYIPPGRRDCRSASRRWRCIEWQLPLSVLSGSPDPKVSCAASKM